MRTLTLAFIFSLFLNPAAKAEDDFGGRVVDLSYSYDENTVYWPTADGFRLEKIAEGKTDDGYFYYAAKFQTAEHGGTHIDAPRHFYKSGRTVDQIPLEQLIGEGVVIDVLERCAEDRDYQISIEDFVQWEARHDAIPKSAIVLLRTGFGKYWPDRKRYMGTDERGPDAVRKLSFPGLHPDAARWLAEERKVKAVGIDTASIDYGQSTLFESHVALFKRNIPAIENLADLDKLPATGFLVGAFPMKIKGGSGGPTRVIAILSE